MVRNAILICLALFVFPISSVLAQADPTYSVGETVEVKFGRGWQNARVVEVRPNGWLKLEMSRDGVKFNPTLPPNRVRKAGGAAGTTPAGKPPENPFEKKKTAVDPLKGVRTWTDASGTFTVEAELVERKDGKVTLKKSDGETIDVPIDQLSEADRKLLRGETTAASSGTSVVAAKSVLRPANWRSVRTVTLDAPNVWSLEPNSPPTSSSLDYRPISLAAANQKSIFESATLIGFDSAQGHALVMRRYSPPGDGKELRLERCDLQSGQSISSTLLPPDVIILDIDPSGTRMLTRTDHRGFGKNGTVTVWDIQAEQPAKLVSFEPHPDGRGSRKDVSWSKFVDVDHVLTVSNGKLACWKAAEAKALYVIDVKATPAMNEGRSYLAVATAQGMFVLDAKSGKALGMLAGDEGVGQKFAFSPDGLRLAMGTHGGRIQVWDCSKGERFRDIYLQSNHPTDPMSWINNDYLLVGKSLLVDVPRRLSLWKYNGIQTAGKMHGEMYWCVTGGGAHGKSLAPLKLPHPAAARVVENADAENLLVFRPGESVRLRVSATNAPSFGPKIKQVLTDRLRQNNMKVSDNASLTLEASSKAGKTRTITYRDFGFRRGSGSNTVQVTPQVYRLTLKDKQGRILWQSSGGSSAPPMLHMQQGETIQQAVAKYTRPNMRFFETQPLPRFVTKPGPHDGAYGVSQVSAQGIQSVK